ncbi:MAG: HAD family hydrolase [Lachnospiraceae bacterium]|nr:HAD family hydrolase [Lachnospiraceae bacterium]MDD3617601.1 HAD family hydrolase [Lachnospiraceae bacterium]
MIQLVASDLDGTLLLNGSQSLEPEVFEYIRQLQKQNILFVAASGRQYDNMARLFGPVKDDIVYICENGSIVFYHDKVIHKSIMDRALGQEMLHAIMEKDTAEVLLSGEHTSYLQPKQAAYEHRMTNIVKNNVTVVEDIMAVQEAYMKISVYEAAGIEESMSYWKERFGERANVVTSGNEWLDMMPKGVNKGMALIKIMEQFNIKPENTIAFGDQYNDLEMLEEVAYGYAMETAHPYVKSQCKYHTRRVQDVLRKIISKENDFFQVHQGIFE